VFGKTLFYMVGSSRRKAKDRQAIHSGAQDVGGAGEALHPRACCYQQTWIGKNPEGACGVERVAQASKNVKKKNGKNKEKESRKRQGKDRGGCV